MKEKKKRINAHRTMAKASPLERLANARGTHKESHYIDKPDICWKYKKKAVICSGD